LDWNTLDEWIGDPDSPIYLAWQDRTLVGAMAGAPVLEGATWLRMVVIADDVPALETLTGLWNVLRHDLLAKSVREVAVLLLRPWLTPLIQELGFAPRDTIVTLRRVGTTAPKPLRSDLVVRSADLRELKRVVAVDHAAFRSLWQLTEPALRQAVRMSSIFRVAELNKEIVAYQLSTLYRDGGHLARLATIPTLQGTGVGGLLLSDLVEQFARRNIDNITVNTNATNAQSLNLYKRYSFEMTGMDMAVWSTSIAP
jgi:ribosomal protein S18 acetylase RimI-like enzyme